MGFESIVTKRLLQAFSKRARGERDGLKRARDEKANTYRS